MEKGQHEDPDSKAEPDLQSQTKSSGTQDVTSCGSSRFKPVRQVKQKRRSDCCQQLDEAERLKGSSDQQPVLIHGLSVERYRDIYNQVLPPSVLATLSSCPPADYVSQVLELKQRLWMELSRPRLEETLREDGRVEVKEIFDLT